MRQRKTKIMRIFVLVIAAFLSEALAFQSCPSVCSCKWKNGKRWVECRNQAQISLPDNIDPETQVLDLTGNNLQILPREVFSRHNLLNLQKLKLSNCNIGQIDPTAFRGLTNLVELDLSGNLLNSIPTPTFSDIPYLRELALNNNPLQRVESFAFEMVSQLESLDLSGCQIRRINPRGFNNIKNLLKLYLHNNKLVELKQKLLENLRDLHSLSLHENPWNCDCTIRPVIEWLANQNIPMTDQPRCAGPHRLKGSRFGDISIQDFACSPEMLPVKQITEGSLGERGALLCRVRSVPAGSINWYREGALVTNSTRRKDGVQKMLVYKKVTGHEISSRLVVDDLTEEDGGEYLCIGENSAGTVHANFTLRTGYFDGGDGLDTGEIVGIVITLVLLLILILIVVFLILIQRVRPYLLRGKKFPGQVTSNAVDSNGSGSNNSNRIVNSTANNQIPNHKSSNNEPDGERTQISGEERKIQYNGLANGYINPDVVPPMENHSNGRAARLHSQEIQQNLDNGMALKNSDYLSLGPAVGSHGSAGGGGHGLQEPRGRYENFPPPLSSVGVSSAMHNRLDSDSLYPSSIYPTGQPAQPASFPHRSSPRSRDPRLQATTTSPLSRRTREPVSPFLSQRSTDLPESYSAEFQGMNLTMSGTSTLPPSSSYIADTAFNSLGVTTASSAAGIMPALHHHRGAYDNAAYQTPSRMKTTTTTSASPLRTTHSAYNTAYRDDLELLTYSTSYHQQPMSLPNRNSDSFVYSTLPRGPNLKQSSVDKVPDWLNPSFSQYPEDFGLPYREKNLHLNPLETLEEEVSSPEYIHPSVKALDMLTHSIGSGYGKSVMDNSSSQESGSSSGRGSSSPGMVRTWTKATKPGAGKVSHTSPRESPDEGIQTDCGTDV